MTNQQSQEADDVRVDIGAASPIRLRRCALLASATGAAISLDIRCTPRLGVTARHFYDRP
jgi:hypothetical protein